MRAVLGEGNPVPQPLVLWLAVAVPLVAALIVLGRMGLWGGRLPQWIFKWGTWAIDYHRAGTGLGLELRRW